MPQVQELFFDDDTFTDDRRRAEEIAVGLGKLGLTWSCNAKANVPRSTLEVLRDNGLRLLLVGYESGNQAVLNQVKKGIRLEIAREFTRNAKALVSWIPALTSSGRTIPNATSSRRPKSNRCGVANCIN